MSYIADCLCSKFTLSNTSFFLHKCVIIYASGLLLESWLVLVDLRLIVFPVASEQKFAPLFNLLLSLKLKKPLILCRLLWLRQR